MPELGRHVKELGFDAIELPVRSGYQVLPENVARDLPKAAATLEKLGIKIASIAGSVNEDNIAACAEAGVPIIRDGISIPAGETYLEAEARVKRELEALVPLLDRHGVTIGLQNHCDRFVANAAGLRRIVEGFNPKHVGAVWDAAHCALDGEIPELAVDILWSHLCMVNLKNAFWRLTNGPEAPHAEWESYWTSGRRGLASWPRVTNELKKRNYRGVVCLTAEYSDHDAVDRLVAGDIEFAKSLFG